MSTTTTTADNLNHVRALLRQAANEAPATDTLVARHEGEPKNKVSIPVNMSTATAAQRLQEAATAENTSKDYERVFRCRPGDGALAARRVMLTLFGTAGVGKAIQTFFGTRPPKEITVEIGLDEYGNPITEQAPWELLEFAPLEGTLYFGAVDDSELGPLFKITANVKLKYATELRGFFALLDAEVRENSIYKGKSIRGTRDPKFINLKRDLGIVYTRAVELALHQAVLRVIKYPDALRAAMPPIKTNPKVLLYGTYGTGKSEAGRMTAQVANEHGYTFVAFESGTGTLQDLDSALKTARLLAPAVVFVEDIDTFARTNNGADPEKQQVQMLEMLDGLSSKGGDVIVLMTTNRPEALPKGMQRAGRISAMIEITYLDREATERLFQTVCGDQLGKVDYDVLFDTFQHYPPAFIRQAIDDARQAAILRTAEELEEAGMYTPALANIFKLNTEDFIGAAAINQSQWESYKRAGEGRSDKPTIESLIAGVTRDTVRTLLVEQVSIYDPANEVNLEVTPVEV